MNYDAFEITEDDIANVLEPHNITDDKKIAFAFDLIDMDSVVDAAMIFIDIDDQTDAAYEKIEETLIEQGFLTGNIRHWSKPL